jgi:hypothetical protein
MAVRAYSGTVRPVAYPYEGNPAYRVAERDEADGSISRGYQEIANPGNFIGDIMVVSAERATALAAQVAAQTQARANVEAFKASIIALAQKVKDNTATAAEQRQLLVKLSRVAVGALSDLP